MKAQLSAREANSHKIRKALIGACTTLLGKQPIEAITINTIVESAGVAKGSFYNHFPDKEALAATVASAIRQDVEARVEASNINVTDPAYKIARGLCNHVQFAISDPGRATIMLRGFSGATSLEHPLNRTVQDHVREGIDSARLASRCRDGAPLVLIGSVIATCITVIEQNLDPQQAIALCTGVFTLVLCGMGLEEAEARRIVTDSATDIITRVPA